MSRTYTVTVHEHIGHEFTIEAESPEDARQKAITLFETEDGDTSYSDVDRVDVQEGKPFGLTWDVAVQ